MTVMHMQPAEGAPEGIHQQILGNPMRAAAQTIRRHHFEEGRSDLTSELRVLEARPSAGLLVE